jgi:hypothetical protein
MWLALPVLAACDGNGDDTGPDDTGDTEDTEDSGDTDSSDTDSGDTDSGDTDSGDTGIDTSDTSDTGATLPSRFFNHSPTCANLSALRPGFGEDGHWAAVRLTPNSYPFDLDTVRFFLLHDPNMTIGSIPCTSNHAYTMRLYITSGTTPPDGADVTPDTGDTGTPFAEEWTFGAGSIVGERVLVGEVDPVITLQSGEHVILAVNTHYTDTDPAGADTGDPRTCIKTCTTGTLATPPRNFWSYAADPNDWDWDDLTLSGTGIWAEGEGFPQ